MNIQECKIDQIVYFPFGDTKRKGIIVGFGKNPVDEEVPLVQFQDNTGIYREPSLCHPKNIEAYYESV